MTPTHGKQVWLVDLATTQRDTGVATHVAVYDDEDQMSYLNEPGRILAISRSDPPQTKKADRETGEDQKGF